MERFRQSFARDPRAAYREWFVLQEHLRDSGEETLAQALAGDLWARLPELRFAGATERARFHHDLGVLLGSSGPISDLERALHCFAVALEQLTPERDAGALGRALHNRANALLNLGRDAADLHRAVAGYEAALEHRGATERPIARGATLQNLGMALARLAELEPEHAAESLRAAAVRFREALSWRCREAHPEAFALTRFQLGLTLERLIAWDGENVRAEAEECFAAAREVYEAAGKEDLAAMAAWHQHRVGI